MALADHSEVVAVAPNTSFLQWTPVVAGAFVASAVSLILIAFGTALGMSIASSSSTWRDTSSALAVASGLYLLIAALVSFGFGGYMAGRLRERWELSASRDVIEFRDGMHGIVSWALAVIITGLVAVTSTATVASKAVQSGTSTSSAAGEPLVAYELDKLFRGDRRAAEGEITYLRAEAARILLTATGRQGVAPDDRAYLTQLVSNRTGLAPAEAESRVNNVITAAATAVRKARRSAVILGFSTAAALLVGAAAAWYAAYNGGRHRDDVAPPSTWTWPGHV
jgi:hypothetical protein